jgi:Spy/CpxP family protein refolding chaperone
MKPWGIGGIVAALVLIAAVGLASRSGYAKSKHPTFTGEYLTMVQQLSLSDEQQGKLDEQIKARKKSMDDWEKTSGPKYAAAQQALASAKTKGNSENIKQAETALKILADGRVALEGLCESKILAVLTPEQRTKWETALLVVAVGADLKAENLSADQQAKVRTVCEKGADTAIKGGSLQQGRDAAKAQALKEIAETVLTPTQRDHFTKKTGQAKNAAGESLAK